MSGPQIDKIAEPIYKGWRQEPRFGLPCRFQVLRLSFPYGGSKLALLSDGRVSQFTGKSDVNAELERHGQEAERPNSKIPSIFDHVVRDSSTIKSNYQQIPLLIHESPDEHHQQRGKD